jgi:cyclin E
MWELMAKKETGMYRRLSPDALLARHPALQPRMRAILLDWLIEVCEVYRLHRETFYLAVDFIDRFLSVSPAVPKNRLQLIGVSCLFIGAKIEEIYPPKLQEFAYVTDGACTEEEILQMELMVLKGLNWGLSPMTPQAWMKMYFQIAHGSKAPCDSAFSMPAYSGLPFSRVMQLLDLAMLDVGCLEFTYSVLAASALYHSDNDTMALHTSGYAWADLAPCVGWMAAAALALRERAPLQPKQFPGIQPDDAHHLQMHSVDLPLLERAQERQRALLLGQGARESPDLALQTGLQTRVSGLANTPQESEGDIMYPPSYRPGGAVRPCVVAHPTPLSPPLDSDIW